jgi:hypothetical protein
MKAYAIEQYRKLREDWQSAVGNLLQTEVYRILENGAPHGLSRCPA